MKLIIIYGISSVGKLTTAKNLQKLTGFKILHNHLSLNLLSSFLDENDDIFWKQVQKIRLDMIKLASDKNQNLIITAGYDGKISDRFLKLLLKLSKKEKIDIKFVHLVCSEKAVLTRVSIPSRKLDGKPTCPKELKNNVDKFGINIKIPYVKSLEIDNTNLSPTKSAKIIKEKLKL